MKTNIKRILSILLSILLLSSIVPLTLSASAGGEHTSGIWTYEIIDGYANLLRCSRIVDGKIEIPETVGGYSVIFWESNIFYNYKNFELVIPKTFPARYVSVAKQRDPSATDGALKEELMTLYSTCFLHCAANKFTVKSGNTYLYAEDGVLYTADRKTLVKYPVCNDRILYSLPTSVEIVSFDKSNTSYLLPEAIFYADTSWGITMPNGLTVHIGKTQFEAMNTTLNRIYSPVDAIANQAFLLIFFGMGASTICTDSTDSMVNLLRAVYEEAAEDPTFNQLPVPDFETCSGHATTPTTKQVTSVSISSLPSKTVYNIGESFDKNGLSLRVYYNDGTSETITSGISCTGFSSDSSGTKTVTASYGGKSTTFTVTVQSNSSMYIQNPSTNTLNYGYTLVLHAQTANLPSGATIRWTADGGAVSLQPSSDTMTCSVKSVSTGSVTITAQLLDRNGNPIRDVSGNAIQSTQFINSRSGFFQRLAYFFKSLFGINMYFPQSEQ